MKCKKCGHENVISAQYCARCGMALRASVEEISAASEEELKRRKSKRIDRSLFTALMVLCILLIPLLFFYFFIPSPPRREVFVTLPFAEIKVRTLLAPEQTKFTESPFLLPLPGWIPGSSGYLAMRKDPRARETLLGFFMPGAAKVHASAGEALARLEAGRNEKGTWDAEESGFRDTAFVLLALLGRGHSTADPERGETIRRALASVAGREGRALRAKKTREYALLLLALMENVLLDPSCGYAAAVPRLLAVLRKAQGSKGTWQASIRPKPFNRADGTASLLAARVLAEARCAGFCMLEEKERKRTVAFLKKELGPKPRGTPREETFFREACAVYTLLLLDGGVVPEEARPVLDALTAEVLALKEEEKLPSLLGAHYLLLALHRSGDRRSAAVNKKILGLYRARFDAEAKGWKEKTAGRAVCLSWPADDVTATAVAVRTLSFPYLYFRFK